MLFRYDAETDVLYILADGVSVESEEVAPGIVLDLDADEHVVGIEIEDASTHADLSRLEVSTLPFSRLVFSERRASQG